MNDNGRMTPTQTDIVRRIDDLFEVTHAMQAAIGNLTTQRREITNEIDQRRIDIKQIYLDLLTLVAVDHNVFMGRTHKVPLIRLYRTAYDCGLKEAKEAVESVLQPRRHMNDDIPF
jgi:ribosomal protein L7/L12